MINSLRPISWMCEQVNKCQNNLSIDGLILRQLDNATVKHYSAQLSNELLNCHFVRGSLKQSAH